MALTTCKVTNKMWIALTASEALDYDKSWEVKCQKCLQFGSSLHFVHDEHDCGDYTCPKDKQGCPLTGHLIYFCFKCKKSLSLED